MGKLSESLLGYPDKEAAVFLAKGFLDGFKIPVAQTPPPSKIYKNLKSAGQHEDVLKQKIEKEVKAGRMAGPFEVIPIEGLVVSPLGVVPKKEQGKFRMIQHLSYPVGASVNDALDKEQCKVQYQSFDEALEIVKGQGDRALLAKVDIESAFRLLPLHPESFKLTGCYFQGAFFVDLCLPMGCAISCSYFEMFSTFLHWLICQRSGNAAIAHYLDDFLIIGPKQTGKCQETLLRFLQMLKELGVPVADEKTVQPTTKLTFLGIEIDTKARRCRLPRDKVEKSKQAIHNLMGTKKVTLREMQQALGLLNFACRVIPMGRIFKRRLEKATTGVKKPFHKIRITKELRADLGVWDSFLTEFNGIRLWLSETKNNRELELLTDASGSIGYGAYFAGKWCAGRWPQAWRELGLTKNLTLLELFPIVVALELWAGDFRDKAIRFISDNMGVVCAVNNLSSDSAPVINLLRQLVLICMRFNISFRAQHIPGVENTLADALSREKWDLFFKLAPNAAKTPHNCPDNLWQLVNLS
ncbi:uncharacterized protein LOC121401560 isoform X1 [Xenopus laevis]|uniref:ribonuclease H n=1 Tax=Xenopus laevis TaxID=8355 RepID=A0A8J1MLX6_XENLA|nr:uncharacterized protein LOC121401529 isoform X1 [Xenopus laevis]XP_041442774.1 uncharacterized protein LOC121401560 isoform X1 [Xenopus laevis]